MFRGELGMVFLVVTVHLASLDESKAVTTKKGSGLERQSLSATVPGAVAVNGNSTNKVAKKAGETFNDATTEAGEEGVKRLPAVNENLRRLR
jgi:hypothetical protein